LSIYSNARVPSGPVCVLSLSSRTVVAAGILVTLLLCVPRTSRAQDTTSSAASAACGPGAPLTDKVCQKQFETWQAGEKKWRDNRRVWGNYSHYRGIRVSRAKRPDPPSWIQSYCQPELAPGVITRLSVVCQAYDEYLRYDWTQHLEGPQSAITYSQHVQTGTGDAGGFVEFLLRHLHYDGMWTNSQNGPRVYGLVGTHLTLAQMGRWYFWGPPGVLLLKQPDGRTDVRITLGVDFLVGDLPIGYGRRLPIYVSVAKAMDKHEMRALQHNINAGMDMVGLSISLRR